MNKVLLKKIVDALGAVLAFVMLLITKVGVSLTVGNETSNPVYKGFFEFLSDAKKVDVFGFARVMMWIGFILVIACMAYFIAILVLHFLNQHKLIGKLKNITKVVEFVLIGAVFVVLIAGFDKETSALGNMTQNITLFGFPWALALVFSAVPFASKYFIKY